jgi:hypothetical protein
MNKIVRLNVGGKIFDTSLETLQKYPKSLLGAAFNDDMRPAEIDQNGDYFFDRDPELFSFILNFYRTGKLPEVTKELKRELKYWGLWPESEESTKQKQFAKETANFIFENSGYGKRSKNLASSKYFSDSYHWKIALGCKTEIVHLDINKLINHSNKTAAEEKKFHAEEKKFHETIWEDIKHANRNLKINGGKYPLIVGFILGCICKNMEKVIYPLTQERCIRMLQGRIYTIPELISILDNIQKYTKWVMQFSVETCELICKYLNKYLDTFSARASWKMYYSNNVKDSKVHLRDIPINVLPDFFIEHSIDSWLCGVGNDNGPDKWHNNGILSISIKSTKKYEHGKIEIPENKKRKLPEEPRFLDSESEDSFNSDESQSESDSSEDSD